jgi:hypothetical protein
LTPITGTFGGTQNTIAISCSGSTDPDLGDVVNYTINAFYNSAWQNLVTAGNGSYVWDISSLSSQIVDLNCSATDGTAQSAYYNPAGNITIDNTAPYYSNDADDSSGTVSENTIVNVSVYWQDSVALSAGVMRTNQSGSWSNVSTCALSGVSDWCNTTINTAGNTSKTICWNQYANDSMNNWNTTMPQTSHCFIVADNTLPYSSDKLTISGDITGDFFVNIKDATQIGLYWMQTVPPAPANVDINGDGIINIKDAAIIGVNWLKHA